MADAEADVRAVQRRGVGRFGSVRGRIGGGESRAIRSRFACGLSGRCHVMDVALRRLSRRCRAIERVRGNGAPAASMRPAEARRRAVLTTP